MDSTASGPLVPPMPRRETPAAAVADVPSGYSDGHALPLAVPTYPAAEGTFDTEEVTGLVPAAPEPEVAAEPASEPAADAAPEGVEEVAPAEADEEPVHVMDGEEAAAAIAMLDADDAPAAQEGDPDVAVPAVEAEPVARYTAPGFQRAFPLPTPGAPRGKDLIVVADGKVVTVPAGMLVVDLDALLHPQATVDDLFAALKELGEVTPSEARDSLVEQVTAAMKARMGF